jgi:hypothetical protein
MSTSAGSPTPFERSTTNDSLRANETRATTKETFVLREGRSLRFLASPLAFLFLSAPNSVRFLLGRHLLRFPLRFRERLKETSDAFLRGHFIERHPRPASIVRMDRQSITTN